MTSAEAFDVTAGEWSVRYESGGLRWLRAHGREVLRALGPTVRDADWQTITPASLRASRGDDGAPLGWVARYEAPDLDVEVSVEIKIDRSLVVMTSSVGFGRRTVAQRIGTSILFPLTTVGVRYEARGGRGGGAGAFPRHISDGLLEVELDELDWVVAPGLEATLSMRGQRWDIEDQRNWSDASFKGFSPPLSPGPTTFDAGSTLQTRVELRVRGSADAAPPDQSRPAVVTVGGATGQDLPPVGCALVGSVEGSLDDLRALAPSHLRCTVDLSRPDWRAAFDAGVETARACDAALVVELLVPSADPSTDPSTDAVSAVAERIATSADQVLGVFVFDRDDGRGAVLSSARQCGSVAQAIQRVAPQVPVGGGTRANLNELRQCVPLLDGAAWSTFAISPTVHVKDDATVIENLEAIPAVVSGARQLMGAARLDVEVALGGRINPYTRAPSVDPLPARLDSRAHDSLGAAWAVAAVALLTGAGVDRVTLFEAVGPSGWVPAPGSRTNLTRVLALLADGGSVLATQRPAGIAALALRRADHDLVLLANLGPEDVEVGVDLGTGTATSCRLGPWGVAALRFAAPPSRRAIA
jgi:D-apionolactonase